MPRLCLINEEKTAFYCQKMKLKFIFAPFLFILVPLSVFPATEINQDTIIVTAIKHLIENSFNEKDSLTIAPENVTPEITLPETRPDSSVKNGKKTYVPIDIRQILLNVEQSRPKTKQVIINDRFLKTNPLFIDILFHGYSAKPVHFDSWSANDYFSKFATSGFNSLNTTKLNSAEEILQELREITIRKFVTYNPHFIAYKIDNLPDVTDFINFELNAKPIDETVLMNRNRLNYDHRRLTIEKIKRNPWTTKSNAMLQFSQNYISKNWYQGGSDNISILGIVNGTFNYDDKKNIQWDNFAEWRMGFNSVEGDTLRLPANWGSKREETGFIVDR